MRTTTIIAIVSIAALAAVLAVPSSDPVAGAVRGTPLLPVVVIGIVSAAVAILLDICAGGDPGVDPIRMSAMAITCLAALMAVARDVADRRDAVAVAGVLRGDPAAWMVVHPAGSGRVEIRLAPSTVDLAGKPIVVGDQLVGTIAIGDVRAVADALRGSASSATVDRILGAVAVR